MPYAYREDTGKINQGWAFLDEGSVPPVPDEDDPTIMAATTPAAPRGWWDLQNPE
jgi:hypothetical protein